MDGFGKSIDFLSSRPIVVYNLETYCQPLPILFRNTVHCEIDLNLQENGDTSNSPLHYVIMSIPRTGLTEMMPYSYANLSVYALRRRVSMATALQQRVILLDQRNIIPHPSLPLSRHNN